MKSEESKKLRELRRWVRKSLKDGSVTERELFAFIRSIRGKGPSREGIETDHQRVFDSIMKRIKDEEDKPSTDHQ
jgi:hypothetical protein